jgi:hypothetical protein
MGWEYEKIDNEHAGVGSKRKDLNNASIHTIRGHHSTTSRCRTTLCMGKHPQHQNATHNVHNAVNPVNAPSRIAVIWLEIKLLKSNRVTQANNDDTYYVNQRMGWDSKHIECEHDRVGSKRKDLNNASIETIRGHHCTTSRCRTTLCMGKHHNSKMQLTRCSTPLIR